MFEFFLLIPLYLYRKNSVSIKFFVKKSCLPYDLDMKIRSSQYFGGIEKGAALRRLLWNPQTILSFLKTAEGKDVIHPVPISFLQLFLHHLDMYLI